MIDYDDFLNPDNQLTKECAECGKPHENKNDYCSNLCAEASML